MHGYSHPRTYRPSSTGFVGAEITYLRCFWFYFKKENYNPGRSSAEGSGASTTSSKAPPEGTAARRFANDHKRRIGTAQRSKRLLGGNLWDGLRFKRLFARTPASLNRSSILAGKDATGIFALHDPMMLSLVKDSAVGIFENGDVDLTEFSKVVHPGGSYITTKMLVRMQIQYLQCSTRGTSSK